MRHDRFAVMDTAPSAVGRCPLSMFAAASSGFSSAVIHALLRVSILVLSILLLLMCPAVFMVEGIAGLRQLGT